MKTGGMGWGGDTRFLVAPGKDICCAWGLAMAMKEGEGTHAFAEKPQAETSAR